MQLSKSHLRATFTICLTHGNTQNRLVRTRDESILGIPMGPMNPVGIPRECKAL